MPKGVYPHKQSWNKGLKKSDHPSIACMGFQPGHESYFSPLQHPHVLKNLIHGFYKGMTPWNKGVRGYEFPKGENHGNWKGNQGGIKDTAEWKSFRKEIFERDAYTCQNCKRVGGYLEMHHKLPKASNPELVFDKDNVTTLCEDCHRKTDSYGTKFAKNYKAEIKPRELLGTLVTETISNQATSGEVEGSETREYGVENAMDPHECAAANRQMI